MLLVNKTASGLVNGSRGVVVTLPPRPGGPVGVQFIGLPVALSVEPETHEMIEMPDGTLRVISAAARLGHNHSQESR
jgi:hypothetical protein